MNYSSLSNKELLEIQKQFIEGKIKEEDIPEDILKDLKELYRRQIKKLNDSTEKNKQKIIEIRKKLKE